MNTFRKAVCLLLVVCMAIGCMTIGAFATGDVTTSAFGQSTYPTVSGNYADTVYAKASVGVGETVTDSGSLVLYSSYGLCTVTNWDTLGGVTKVTSNNPNVATAAITHNGSTLNVAITGVANGTATITVDYCGQTTVNSNQIYSGTNGVANGYIKYTVTVGTGSSSGGSTTPDPTPGDGLTVDTQGRYVIYTQADLAAVANDMTASYILANDIALTGNWTPLGWTDSNDVAFTGTFDGNGYTISGFTSAYSSGAQNVGLFAINNGNICNLTISVDEIFADRYVGAVAGQNKGTISDVTVNQTNAIGMDTISAQGIKVYSNTAGMYLYESYVGGVTGRNYGRIESCEVAVQVVGYTYVGGIVGKNESGATVSETAFSGGVNSDYANSNETSLFNYTGGLVGMNNGTINDCYANLAADLVGGTAVGGAVGGNASTASVGNVWTDVQGKLYFNSSAGYLLGANNAAANKLTQNYTVHTSNTGTTTGATFISPANLQSQTTFPQKATNWDWDSVWTYSDGENENYPILQNCGNSGVHEDIVLPSTSTEVTVTFAAGDVRQGDNVTLPTPNPVTVTVPADGKGSLVLEQDASRTSVVKGATWYYRFIGWTDGETVYDLGASVEVTEDITLNAVWKLYTVDGDKAWTYLDAMAIMDYLAGNVEFYSEQIDVANYDNDDSVSYLDAMAIMDVLAGTTPAPTTT